jgi:hypothetical protein
MRVRCAKLINEQTGQQIEKSPWLSIGKVYLVLEVSVSERKHVKFRLMSDDNDTPALHEFSQFEPVSDAIPKCWVTLFEPGRYLCLTPSAFAQPGFWERYFDGEEAARQTFLEVCRALDAEDP